MEGNLFVKKSTYHCEFGFRRKKSFFVPRHEDGDPFVLAKITVIEFPGLGNKSKLSNPFLI